MTGPAGTVHPVHSPRAPEAPVTDDTRTHRAALPDVTFTADRVEFPPAPATQGDVWVLPWLEATAPAMRAERAAATTLIPDGGQPIEDGSLHVIHPDPDARPAGVRYAYVGKGNTIGTLVVADRSTATLHHPDHPDVEIGPGVYALHRQPHTPPTPRRRR